MTKNIPPTIKKFPTAKQRRMDQLLEKNGDGTITESERARLKQLVAEAEQLMVENAQRLADSSAATENVAVPVTVWIKPASAEQ